MADTHRPRRWRRGPSISAYKASKGHQETYLVGLAPTEESEVRHYNGVGTQATVRVSQETLTTPCFHLLVPLTVTKPRSELL